MDRYDAIILGIRAYNTVERLKFYQPKLLEYVEKGGTMIVQYNTTWRLKMDKEKILKELESLSQDFFKTITDKFESENFKMNAKKRWR